MAGSSSKYEQSHRQSNILNLGINLFLWAHYELLLPWVLNFKKMQLNICRSPPDFQIRICGFGFEPPDLDLTIFQKVGFGLDLSFFKGVDLDLKVELDSDLNIAGFARHCMKATQIKPAIS